MAWDPHNPKECETCGERGCDKFWDPDEPCWGEVHPTEESLHGAWTIGDGIWYHYCDGHINGYYVPEPEPPVEHKETYQSYFSRVNHAASEFGKKLKAHIKGIIK